MYKSITYLKAVVLVVLFAVSWLNIVRADLVYVTKVKAGAVKVYITRNPAEADVRVYQTKNKAQAKGNSGYWYFTSNAAEAKKKVYITTNPAEADIKVYYTGNMAEAKGKGLR